MKRNGFALVEAAVLAIVAACLTALILLLGADQRRQGRLGEDIGKLREIGALTQQYAADNADMFWTFSWRAGQSLSQWPELNNASSDGQAGANQLVDILRRRAGRLDIGPLVGLVAHVNYSHLPLLDYAQRVPDETFVSAADKNRLLWCRDPLGFDQGWYQPAPAGVPGDPNAKRWAYSGSFVISTAFYDRSPVPNRLYPSGPHNVIFAPADARLGAKLTADARYPAQKVFVHDSNARHFGAKQPYCTHDEARLPLLFVDGTVAIKHAAESNGGWYPNSPASSGWSSFSYQPAAWEPPTYSGNPSDFVTGRFRWTRGYLDGRDFGGPEVCTGQPGCP